MQQSQAITRKSASNLALAFILRLNRVAVLLGVGRCVGETMAVLMVTGHAVRIPDGLYSPVRTLTATIAAELGEAVRGGEHYQALFALGILLFFVTFLVNLAADAIVRERRLR